MSTKRLVALVALLAMPAAVAVAQRSERPGAMSSTGPPSGSLSVPKQLPLPNPLKSGQTPIQRHGPRRPSHRPGDHHGRRSFVFFPYYYPYYYSYDQSYEVYPYSDTHYNYGPYLYYDYYAYPPGYLPGAPDVTPQAPQPPQPAGEDVVFESLLSPMLGGPDRVGAAFALGETKLRMGEYADACVAFQRAHEMSPNDPVAQAGVALALEGAGRCEGAAYMLRRALASLPDWSAVNLSLADAFGGAERFEAVMLQVQEAAARAPEDVDLRILVGFNYFGAGQYARAASVLLPLAQAVPEDEAVKGLLAAAESRLGGEVPKGLQAKVKEGGAPEAGQQPGPTAPATAPEPAPRY